MVYFVQDFHQLLFGMLYNTAQQVRSGFLGLPVFLHALHNYQSIINTLHSIIYTVDESLQKTY